MGKSLTFFYSVVAMFTAKIQERTSASRSNGEVKQQGTSVAGSIDTCTHLLLELDDGGGVDLVHEPAENDPVLQYLGVVSLRHRLVQHSRDPLPERIRTGF
jgi:hypothetical protein